MVQFLDKITFTVVRIREIGDVVETEFNTFGAAEAWIYREIMEWRQRQAKLRAQLEADDLSGWPRQNQLKGEEREAMRLGIIKMFCDEMEESKYRIVEKQTRHFFHEIEIPVE
jgi:hypothetical protein